MSAVGTVLWAVLETLGVIWVLYVGPAVWIVWRLVVRVMALAGKRWIAYDQRLSAPRSAQGPRLPPPRASARAWLDERRQAREVEL